MIIINTDNTDIHVNLATGSHCNSSKVICQRPFRPWQAATAPQKICLCQKTIAEVQGAIVDGFLGVAYPKPMKVGLYVCLALELLRRACYTVAVLFTFACSGAPFCLP